jgi:hypothetical protein
LMAMVDLRMIQLHSVRRHPGCSIGGSASKNEIPPPGTLLH